MTTQAPVMTKNCIAPWQMFEIAVDGTFRPCSGTISGDFGNINNFLREPSQLKDAFFSDAHKQLREQLLTGNLQSECVNCRCAPDEKIPTEALRHLVSSCLRKQGRNISLATDLRSEFAFEICTTGITDKCNLACIYCFTHSNDKPGDGMRGYCEVNRNNFLQMIATLVESGLKRLHLCGGGEITTYSTWKELCTELLDRYPQLNMSVVSNFGKQFTDNELDVLMRFSEITISCDTIDPEQFSYLRRGGRVEVLLNNIARLKGRFRNSGRNPVLILNVTESNVIIDSLVDLARYAVNNDIGLQFSNLIIVKESYADINNSLMKIADIPDEQIPSTWEILCDLPERFRAEKPDSNNYLLFGPFYEIIKQRAEAKSLNRFVPTAKELFYSSFAAAHPKNPNALLRKVFWSFDDCYRGILIHSGSTIDIVLPYEAGRLTYRLIWINSSHTDSFISPVQEAFLGQYVSIDSVKTGEYYSNVLLEVLSYEQDKAMLEILPLTEPLHESAALSPDWLVAQAQNDLGTLCMEHGDINRARRHLERAIQLQPENILYNKNMADLLSVALEFEEALRIYVTLLAKAPSDIELLKRIAHICRQIGQPNEARYFLEMALVMQPCDSVILEVLQMMELSE